MKHTTVMFYFILYSLQALQWTSTKSYETPPVILDGYPLLSVVTQKQLAAVIDNDLRWFLAFQLFVRKWHSYYLYLIGCHQRNLPVAVLKMLVQSLVLSHLRYAVPVWEPSLSHNSQSRLEKMFNRAVRAVYGLRKFNHVSALRRNFQWLSVQSLIQHHCLLMLYQHHQETQYRYIHQFNLIDNHIMRWKLPPILPFHVDLNFHLCRGFFIRKGRIGGIICRLMYLTVMDIMDSKCRHFSIFWTMI